MWLPQSLAQIEGEYGSPRPPPPMTSNNVGVVNASAFPTHPGRAYTGAAAKRLSVASAKRDQRRECEHRLRY